MNKKQLKTILLEDFSSRQTQALLNGFEFAKHGDVTLALDEIARFGKDLQNAENQIVGKAKKEVLEPLQHLINEAKIAIDNNKKVTKKIGQTLEVMQKQLRREINEYETVRRKTLEKFNRGILKRYDIIEAKVDVVTRKLNTSTRKGQSFECNVQDYFECRGFVVLKADLSRGMFDLVATKKGTTYWIQCKLNGKLSKAERNIIEQDCFPLLGIGKSKNVIACLAYNDKKGKIEFENLLSGRQFTIVFSEDLQQWKRVCRIRNVVGNKHSSDCTCSGSHLVPVKQNESQNEYIKRCSKELRLHHGYTNETEIKATAFGIWRLTKEHQLDPTF